MSENAVHEDDAVAGPHDHEADTTIRDVLTGALDKYSGGEVWTVRENGFWLSVSPPGHLGRDQGWKLHVSATPLSVPEVLERVAKVLCANRCAFKVARGLREVEELVSSRADRGSGGKVITVYPNDDDHFRAVVGELDEATAGLPGPGILSDRALKPGSLVHYRYGGFSPKQVLNTEGSYQYMLVAPDGSYLPDERQAWFSPPPWAPPPLPETPKAKPEDARGKAVLLADRFVVREAIRHSFRGGVYRATDTTTDEQVIIKQARPHVGADVEGNDARDWMRHEADMLDLLEPTGFTPRKVHLFEYQRDMFLAEEQIDGKSLRHWVEERAKLNEGRQITVAEAETMARELVDLLAAVHERGLVVRDFNPGNIVVPGNHRPRLIDLEFLAQQGSHVRNVATVGYVAPEQLAAPRYGLAPEPTADRYSLGATLLHLSTRMDPVFPPDDGEERTTSDRLAAFVRGTAGVNPAARRLAPLIIGLTVADPARRWTLGQASRFLDTPLTERPVYAATADDAKLGAEDQERMLADGLRYTVETMTPDQPHLWPPITASGLTSDPCNVQSGAGGVLGVLTEAARVRDVEGLPEALRTAARWLDRRLHEEPRVLPGLYFGRSGAAWALHEAAGALDDAALAERALAYAKRVPIRWPNPDMTHGTAGAGTVMLHLLQATGDPDFAQRTHGCARALIDAVERRRDLVTWPVPEEFNSQMAGISHHGYAHGVAGVSNFLLTAGLALDVPEYVELAEAGGEAMCHAVIREGDAALWPTGEPGVDDMGLTWWCSGSAGVGTFLIRLWKHTGDDRYRELAEAGARAVRNERWLLSPSACHGGSGGAEFLLDLAAVLGDDTYRGWAEEMALSIHARSTLRGGKLIAPGDSMNSIEMGYNSGLAGVLGFLLRLRHGGRRLWMAEDLALPAAAARAPVAAGAAR